MAAQIAMLVAALAGPVGVAAATLGFTLQPPVPSTVQYSDMVKFKATLTCVNDAASNCPTTSQTYTASFSIRPSGGTTFFHVGTVTKSFFLPADPTTCGSFCEFEFGWRSGRIQNVTVPPGVYDVGLTTSLSSEPLELPGGLTITREATTATYTGGISGLGGTPLTLSGTVLDQDRGVVSGTGIISPDTNLIGTGVVTFQLYDATNTTPVAGVAPVSANLTSFGVITLPSGTPPPSMPLPAAGGTFTLRTTYVGNSLYEGSSDVDTITVTPGSTPNTPPVLSVPPLPVEVDATSPDRTPVTFPASATDAEDDPDPVPTCDPASGTAFSLGVTTVTCTVRDSQGASDTDTFEVRVLDMTDPFVDILTDERAGQSDWFNIASNDGTAGVTVKVTTADAVGVTSLTCIDGDLPLLPLNASGGSFVLGDGRHTVTCTATDAAGHSNADKEEFKIDQTAPSITSSVAPVRASTGWWNADTGAPTAEFSCSDTSLVASCSPAFTFGEGSNQSTSGTATDVAGNSATADVTGIDVDLTPPSIESSLAPARGATGWWNADTGAPTASFTCSDDLSGVAHCSPPFKFGEGANLGTSGTATDVAGNSATADVTGIDVDLTAPTITSSLAPARAATGWWNADTGAPTATFSCSDGLSEVENCSAPFRFAEGSGQWTSGTATDKAGNSASANVTGIDVDLSAPGDLRFTGGGLVDGGEYAYLFVPDGPTGCVATDLVSDVAACTVSGYSDAVGAHSIRGRATDAAGNTSVASLDYRVSDWTVTPFAKPIDMVGLNAVKAGGTAQLKFEVFAGSVQLTSVDVVSTIQTEQLVCPQDARAKGKVGGGGAGAGGATSSTVESGGGGRLIVRWVSPDLPDTCWRVTVRTIDGSSLSASFKLR